MFWVVITKFLTFLTLDLYFMINSLFVSECTQIMRQLQLMQVYVKQNGHKSDLMSGKKELGSCIQILY